MIINLGWTFITGFWFSTTLTVACSNADPVTPPISSSTDNFIVYSPGLFTFTLPNP